MQQQDLGERWHANNYGWGCWQAQNGRRAGGSVRTARQSVMVRGGPRISTLKDLRALTGWQTGRPKLQVQWRKSVCTPICAQFVLQWVDGWSEGRRGRPACSLVRQGKCMPITYRAAPAGAAAGAGVAAAGVAAQLQHLRVCGSMIKCVAGMTAVPMWELLR